MGRKACAGAGRTACRCSGTALAVGRLAVMTLLVRAHRIGAVIVDRHIGGFGPAGRALHIVMLILMVVMRGILGGGGTFVIYTAT